MLLKIAPCLLLINAPCLGQQEEMFENAMISKTEGELSACGTERKQKCISLYAAILVLPEADLIAKKAVCLASSSPCSQLE